MSKRKCFSLAKIVEQAKEFCGTKVDIVKSLVWDSVDKKCITNVFNKAGFSKSESNDEISPSPSDHNGTKEEDSVAEGENFPEVDDAYINCDAHLIISQIPSIFDLMPTSDDSGDEDEMTEDVPTADQAIQSIKTRKQILMSNVNQEANLQKIVIIERAIVEIVSKSKKQVKITNFFQ
ncbi:hypothetical protein AVEN_135247-1 [Araneus ventricosus]|uniref:Uncharacterized protein n=1 Tax=Araneus ventricosus TaxID=182803 RepID=A0A4Y2CN73_ARAVE|nr:hypothetical protein AVEN_135247-1 [Araneus ventricosus]